jgi:antiviral helicase SLH1
VPPVRQGANYKETPLVPIEDLDSLCRGTFKGYKTLNRVQSLVYPVAYKTNENMLICAPTGAVL